MEAVISLHQYRELNFDAKASLVLKYGKFIEERKTVDGSRICMFELFGFYVEISFRYDQRVQYIKAVEDYYDTRHLIDNIEVLHLN